MRACMLPQLSKAANLRTEILSAPPLLPPCGRMGEALSLTLRLATGGYVGLGGTVLWPRKKSRRDSGPAKSGR